MFEYSFLQNRWSKQKSSSRLYVQRNIRRYCDLAYSINTPWSIVAGWIAIQALQSVSYTLLNKMNVSDLILNFVSRDANLEHFHGFKEKNIWRILTQATIIGKGGEFPKHSAYNDILHSSLLKPWKDTFNILKSIAPWNPWENMNLSH